MSSSQLQGQPPVYPRSPSQPLRQALVHPWRTPDWPRAGQGPSGTLPPQRSTAGQVPGRGRGHPGHEAGPCSLAGAGPVSEGGRQRALPLRLPPPRCTRHMPASSLCPAGHSGRSCPGSFPHSGPAVRRRTALRRRCAGGAPAARLGREHLLPCRPPTPCCPRLALQHGSHPHRPIPCLCWPCLARVRQRCSSPSQGPAWGKALLGRPTPPPMGPPQFPQTPPHLNPILTQHLLMIVLLAPGGRLPRAVRRGAHPGRPWAGLLLPQALPGGPLS